MFTFYQMSPRNLEIHCDVWKEKVKRTLIFCSTYFSDFISSEKLFSKAKSPVHERAVSVKYKLCLYTVPVGLNCPALGFFKQVFPDVYLCSFSITWRTSSRIEGPRSRLNEKLLSSSCPAPLSLLSTEVLLLLSRWHHFSPSISPSSVSRSGMELYFFFFWVPLSWQLKPRSGHSKPLAPSRFSRGGLGGGEHAMKMFCSLWELCRSRPWPIFKKERSPKLSMWAPLPICERCRKSASGRLIMLTERTSLRLESLLAQRPEDGFLYKDVLRGIVRGLDGLLDGSWGGFITQRVLLRLIVTPQNVVKGKRIMASATKQKI